MQVEPGQIRTRRLSTHLEFGPERLPMEAGRRQLPPGTDHDKNCAIARAGFSYRNRVEINPPGLSIAQRRRRW